jgi:hypothetical protein
MTTILRESFACWRCERPEAVSARAWLSSCDQIDLETHLSPGGNPMCCCRVVVVAVIPQGAEVSHGGG